MRHREGPNGKTVLTNGCHKLSTTDRALVCRAALIRCRKRSCNVGELIDLLAICSALTVSALPGAGAISPCERHRCGCRARYSRVVEAHR